MIAVLTTLCMLLLIAVGFALTHIKLINKELDEISKEQSRQNADIRNLMIAHITLVDAIKRASETNLNETSFSKKIIGEA